MAEIRPPLDAIKSVGLVDGLTLEMVRGFDYLFMCFNESLRIESVVSHRVSQTVERDTTLEFDGKVIPLKKDCPISIFYPSVHKDPHQWPEPEVFEPERFSHSGKGDKKWLQTSDGQPRNPFAFTPWMGGKRVCLGKGLVETMLRFTIPLIYHHWELDFV